MSVIYSRVFASATRNYLNLATGDYMRPIAIGDNWNRIRIGMLCSLGTVDELAVPIRGASFNVGVCSGYSSSSSMLAPSHFVGFGWPSTPDTGNSLTYNAGSGGNSYFTGTWMFYKYAAGVKTTSAVGADTMQLPSNATTGGALARRGVFVLEINKSALYVGNITQSTMHNATAHMSQDLTSSDLQYCVESATVFPYIQGTATLGQAIGNSIAFNEIQNGPLNTINIFWNHYLAAFQLYELTVYRAG